MSDDRQLVTRRADLAFGILKFIAGLALFGMLYGVLDLAVDPLFGDLGLSATGSQLTQTQGFIETTWDVLPFLVLLIVAVFLISRAAFESRGGV
jgi:hypothetical protein